MVFISRKTATFISVLALQFIVLRSNAENTKQPSGPNIQEESRIGFKAQTQTSTSQTFFDSCETLVKAKRFQNTEIGGLALTVAIINKSKTPIQIKNPIDHLSFMVVYEDKFVELPYVTKRNGDYARGFPKELYLPFKLLNIVLNKRILTKKELMGESVAIPPNGNLQIHCLIDRIEDSTTQDSDAKRNVPGRVKRFIAPRPGNYKVVTNLSLYSAKSFDVAKKLESDEFNEVQLLPPVMKEVAAVK